MDENRDSRKGRMIIQCSHGKGTENYTQAQLNTGDLSSGVCED